MLTARMTEYETQLASAVAKTSALEKIKNQLQLDSESLVMQLDKVDIYCALVKRQYFNQTTSYITCDPVCPRKS